MRHRDPLLTIARLTIVAVAALTGFAAVIAAIGVAALLTVERASLFAKLAAAGAPATAYWPVVIAVALILGLLILTLLFFRELWRIVVSVDRGDPFDPVNADRLQRMAWLALAVQGALLIIGTIAFWLGHYAAEAQRYADYSVDGGGILLALVLFILARVFRRGAEMRDELEGTV
jgi:hypothetical protein